MLGARELCLISGGGVALYAAARVFYWAGFKGKDEFFGRLNACVVTS
jgi:hypothetical protein